MTPAAQTVAATEVVITTVHPSTPGIAVSTAITEDIAIGSTIPATGAAIASPTVKTAFVTATVLTATSAHGSDGISTTFANTPTVSTGDRIANNHIIVKTEHGIQNHKDGSSNEAHIYVPESKKVVKVKTEVDDDPETKEEEAIVKVETKEDDNQVINEQDHVQGIAIKMEGEIENDDEGLKSGNGMGHGNEREEEEVLGLINGKHPFPAHHPSSLIPLLIFPGHSFLFEIISLFVVPTFIWTPHLL
jgi:hypothetical protein